MCCNHVSIICFSFAAYVKGMTGIYIIIIAVLWCCPLGSVKYFQSAPIETVGRKRKLFERTV